MIKRKGWYLSVRTNKKLKLRDEDKQLYHDYDATYSSNRSSFGGLKIHINSYPNRQRHYTADYKVMTSGMPIRIYERKFTSLPRAEAYVRRVMRWFDSGRMKLKVVRND